VGRDSLISSATLLLAWDQLKPMGLLSSNIAVCETIIWERSDVPTLIRVMSVITLRPDATSVHFLVVTSLDSQPGDLDPHTVLITVADKNGNIVASTEPFGFSYGYKLDPNGPGAFIMTTEVTLEISKLPTELPSYFLVSAFLDTLPDPVSLTPLMLRRE
jgi:hypothetical protein